MTRSSQDLAWLFATQTGYGPHTPLSLGSDSACFMQPLHRDFRQARIGWLGDFGGCLTTNTEVLAVDEYALGTFDTPDCHIGTVRPLFAMDTLWEC